MKEMLSKHIKLVFDVSTMFMAFILVVPGIYEMAIKETNDPYFTVIFCLGTMFILYKLWDGVIKINGDQAEDMEKKEVIKESNKRFISWMKERNRREKERDEAVKEVEEKSREKSQTTY